MRILIVEDEPLVARWAAAVLTEAGHLVTSADNGDDGFRLGIAGGLDLALVDVQLPARSGISVVRGIRQAGHTMPVIIMTGRADDGDVVRGLDAGADDYLVKPVAAEVLKARVRAALRRGGGPARDQVAVDALVLDRRAHQVRCAGRLLGLTPREFSLIERFMSRQGEVVSRAELLSQVWGMDFDPQSNVIDATMHRLRAKLHATGCAARLRTVRGVGYVLASAPAAPE